MANQEPDTDHTILKNEAPQGLLSVFSTGFEFMQEYGWFILLALVAILYIKNKFIQPKLAQWQQTREENKYKKMDSGKIQEQAERLEKARQKMQAELDKQAEEYKIKQQQKEEKARQDRIADWDRHQEGKGYRSKVKPKEEDQPRPGSQPKPKGKKPLTDNDYNPLMGGSSSAGFRPPRRGASGGG